MVDPVAQHYGIEMRRVLTGFKYIGDQIASLEAAGHPERYLLGLKRAMGICPVGMSGIRMAVDGSMLICEMAQYYKEKGMTLVDAMNELYETYGYYVNGVVNQAFEGEAGMKQMTAIMDRLRKNPPSAIAGFAVVGHSDYQESVRVEKGETTKIDLPKSNVLEYRLENGCKLIVRPSGYRTEDQDLSVRKGKHSGRKRSAG